MDKSSIYLLAMVYAFREECIESSNKQKPYYGRTIYHLPFGRFLNNAFISRNQTTERHPLNLNDLDLFLAFRPWSGRSERIQYLRAIRDSEKYYIGRGIFRGI